MWNFIKEKMWKIHAFKEVERKKNYKREETEKFRWKCNEKIGKGKIHYKENPTKLFNLIPVEPSHPSSWAEQPGAASPEYKHRI